MSESGSLNMKVQNYIYCEQLHRTGDELTDLKTI